MVRRIPDGKSIFTATAQLDIMRRKLQTSMKWPVKLTLPFIFARERILVSLGDGEIQRNIDEEGFRAKMISWVEAKLSGFHVETDVKADDFL